MGQSEKNQNRNRFVDIIPYDDNYVSLQVRTSSSNISKENMPYFQKEQGLPLSTYVNASYVDDLDGVGKVIVTQVNLLKIFDVTTEHIRVRNRTQCWTSGGWLLSTVRGILSC